MYCLTHSQTFDLIVVAPLLYPFPTPSHSFLLSCELEPISHSVAFWSVCRARFVQLVVSSRSRRHKCHKNIFHCGICIAPYQMCECVCLSQPLWHLPLGSLINLLAPFLLAAQPDRRRQRKFPSQSSWCLFFFRFFYILLLFIRQRMNEFFCASFMHFSAQ